ncbi:hypothetical protein JL720_10185 [Aureococcus anophagefferens]|nr:hypothetical protein JL720_10185 [Aureococcus anophagefferens]
MDQLPNPCHWNSPATASESVPLSSFAIPALAPAPPVVAVPMDYEQVAPQVPPSPPSSSAPTGSRSAAGERYEDLAASAKAEYDAAITQFKDGGGRVDDCVPTKPSAPTCSTSRQARAEPGVNVTGSRR